MRKKARDTIEVFKKDLISFCRYYEFSSQIVDFDDFDLGKAQYFC